MPVESELRERMLTAWTDISGYLKNSRMTQGITYNEAVTMKLVYEQYQKDGVGLTPVQTILKRTHMLKSLGNRTINALCAQGYLVKEQNGPDARMLYVRPVPERLPDFLAVHERSLQLAGAVIEILGEQDAESFVRICEKFLAADFQFT
ncbi:MAG: winged helix-turn-helix transcriptional regulator [Subdoligranulum sp.]|nr:winged helix-turn-helix transcriptional regulator [Subdoligranulum sp.]